MSSSDKTQLDPAALQRLAGRVGRFLDPAPEGRGRRVAIACARFNGGVTTRLLEGALEALGELGVEPHDVTVAWAPGAFELPLVARALCAGAPDAVIALGAVIRGDTGHYDFVAGECARGLQEVALSTGVPVVFGVLTTDTADQALERSRPGESNKGAEAAHTALATAALLRGLAAR